MHWRLPAEPSARTRASVLPSLAPDAGLLHDSGRQPRLGTSPSGLIRPRTAPSRPGRSPERENAAEASLFWRPAVRARSPKSQAALPLLVAAPIETLPGGRVSTPSRQRIAS